MKKDRNRWEIILDILTVTNEERKAKETRIMQRAYLDWKNFQRYHNFLLEEGYIAKCNPEFDSCELTDNGRNFMKELKELDYLLKTAILKSPSM
jgi:predicted transcriptional regulator